MTVPAVITEAADAPIGDSTAVKRCLDLVVAVIALVVLAPLLVAIAIALRASAPACPAVFRQRRVGKAGREFTIWKFRTMVPDAEKLSAQLAASSGDPNWIALERDPRVTRIGGILRRFCLDELPQLVNVLRGEMSLVGPRPLPPAEQARAPEWATQRLAVRPGITGLWQVTSSVHLSYAEMLRLDCRYVRERSFWKDAEILLRTLPALIIRRPGP